MSVKIPFARSRDLGRLCEISEVPSGRRCNCVCPSCGQSVIARQGEKNEWHFGHDSTPEHHPQKECEISFWVCCRQFIVDCAVGGLLPSFVTPSIWLTRKYNRGATDLSALDWHRSDITNYDLMATIGDFTLHLYLSYENRENPLTPDPGTRTDKSGFLALSIQSLEKDIDHHSRLGNGILKQARLLFEDRGQGVKQWLRHPLECLEPVKVDIERERREERARIENERIQRDKALWEKVEAQARLSQIARQMAIESGLRSKQAEAEKAHANHNLDANMKAAINRYPNVYRAIKESRRGRFGNPASVLMFLLNRHRKAIPGTEWPSEDDIQALYRKYNTGQKI